MELKVIPLEDDADLDHLVWQNEQDWWFGLWKVCGARRGE